MEENKNNDETLQSKKNLYTSQKEYLEKIGSIRKKFNSCNKYFSTLADTVRQEILLILAESGIEGMDVQDITARTHLSRPAISHHLKILKDAGMIISHKKGTQVYYFIYIQKTLEDIKDLLTTVENLVSDIDMESVKQKAPWMVANEG